MEYILVKSWCNANVWTSKCCNLFIFRFLIILLWLQFAPNSFGGYSIHILRQLLFSISMELMKDTKAPSKFMLDCYAAIRCILYCYSIWYICYTIWYIPTCSLVSTQKLIHCSVWIVMPADTLSNLLFNETYSGVNDLNAQNNINHWRKVKLMPDCHGCKIVHWLK